jgi:lactoylglutathione lyase
VSGAGARTAARTAVRTAAHQRAFPVLRVGRVAATAAFYERLGFTRRVTHPDSGEPEFVALRRGDAELALTQRPGGVPQPPSAERHFEIFVFVEPGSLDAVVACLREEGVRVLSEPVRMPWGERVAKVADPEGNVVALASPAV